MVSAIVRQIIKPVILLILAMGVTEVSAIPPAGKLLIFRPGSKIFDEAYEGLVAGLEETLAIERYTVDRDTSPADIGEQIDKVRPDIIALMENRTVGLYNDYQRQQPEGATFPPAVVLMTLYVGKYLRDMKNVVGISYEVPGINSLQHLRALVLSPIRRVGVVYSGVLEPFFLEQQKSCRAEDIELVGRRLEREDLEPRVIKKALQQLLRKEKIDALWVLNESEVLSEKNVKRAWVPVLKACKKPILVGVKNLIELGHLGVFPDHYALGEQAASVVHETRENNWILIRPFTRQPITVEKIANKSRAKSAKIKLREEVLLEMDTVIE